jgi:hypothetical protein
VFGVPAFAATSTCTPGAVIWQRTVAKGQTFAETITGVRAVVRESLAVHDLVNRLPAAGRRLGHPARELTPRQFGVVL